MLQSYHKLICRDEPVTKQPTTEKLIILTLNCKYSNEKASSTITLVMNNIGSFSSIFSNLSEIGSVNGTVLFYMSVEITICRTFEKSMSHSYARIYSDRLCLNAGGLDI